MKPCCTPSREIDDSSVPLEGNFRTNGEMKYTPEVADIPGGLALVGTNHPYFPTDGEKPLRRKKTPAFRIGETTVTNTEFATFVSDTGYVTDAERLGDSLVFQGLLPKGTPPSCAVVDAPWWRMIPGSNWRDLFGPNTANQEMENHPVVHVSWNDAAAFAAWAGGRLPTEVEWEHAARGGLGDVPFPWGRQEPNNSDFYPCNIWQGRFPQQNLGLDGYIGTAPAKSFLPNAFGLYNMVGNVWELTSEILKVRSLKKEVIAANANRKGFILSKGGSFLCHKSYCFRYRIAARNMVSKDTSASHMGFRVVYKTD